MRNWIWGPFLKKRILQISGGASTLGMFASIDQTLVPVCSRSTCLATFATLWWQEFDLLFFFVNLSAARHSLNNHQWMGVCICFNQFCWDVIALLTNKEKQVCWKLNMSWRQAADNRWNCRLLKIFRILHYTVVLVTLYAGLFCIMVRLNLLTIKSCVAFML